MFLRPLLLGVFSLTLLASACRKSEVTSYQVPKEKNAGLASAPHAHAEMPAPVGTNAPAARASGPMATQAPGAAGGMAGTAVPTATGGDLAWTAPAHWKSIPATAMRKGTYMIPGESGVDAELSITAFPGDVGGELANLNRWRAQAPFQLPAITEAELAAAVTRRASGDLKIGLVELVSTGTSKSRLLGAWVPYAGSTWFFKLTGPDALIAKEKPAFLAFLDSIKPAAPTK